MKTIQLEDIQSYFIKREKDVNKGDFGKVGFIGGSKSYSGALKLAMLSHASLRSGCGISRVLIPEELAPLLAPYILEQTMFFYHNLEELKEGIHDLDVLAIGMGWGKDTSHLSILREICNVYSGVMVIDADGLNTLVGHLDMIKDHRVVLTPHLKEFSRISQLSMEEIKQNPIEIVKEFAKKYGVILLLKGSTTIISDGVDVYLVKSGCPGMATAGSGDVLSGVLAGLLAYHPFHILTVAAGAYLAGLAGELAENEKTDIAMIASDTIEHIPNAITWIRKQEKSSQH